MWYHEFSSYTGYSCAEPMKSIAPCTTSTSASFSPTVAKPGISQLGRSSLSTPMPMPQCAYPVTAPWARAHCMIGRFQLGQSVGEEVAGYSGSVRPSSTGCPEWLDGKPDTSRS